jgi:hypothetical protein
MLPPKMLERELGPVAGKKAGRELGPAAGKKAGRELGPAAGKKMAEFTRMRGAGWDRWFFLRRVSSDAFSWFGTGVREYIYLSTFVFFLQTTPLVRK